MPETKVGFVCCSGFKRLAADVGSFRCYFDAEKAGRVPHPYFITGASAGAVASVICLPWTEKNFDKVTEAIINLKPSDICSIGHLTELFGALTLGESFLNFIPVFQHDYFKTRRGRLLLELVKSGLSVAAKTALFWELLKQPSIFSSEPLRRLLRQKKPLDFRAIWSSVIKLEIPAVDLKSNQMFYFTNYLPEHREWPNRDDSLVDAVRGSSSVPAFLPAISFVKYLLDDAALLNPVPLDRAMRAGCDVIFVLMHRPYMETADLKTNKITWVDELNQAMDLAIGHSAELTLRWHEKINQDLEVIEQLEKMEYANGPARVLLSKLSAYGQKKTRIIPVIGEQPLPDLTFDKFNPKDQQLGYQIGYQNMKKALDSFCG